MHHCQTQYYLMTSGVSSTSTLPDLPGPGRGLDKLYNHFGNMLEKSISLIAHRMGFGPCAVSHHLEVVWNGHYGTMSPSSELLVACYSSANKYSLKGPRWLF